MLKAFGFVRDPSFWLGAPLFVVALIYDQPVLMGLGLSLITCAMIAS